MGGVGILLFDLFIGQASAKVAYNWPLWPQGKMQRVLHNCCQLRDELEHTVNRISIHPRCFETG